MRCQRAASVSRAAAAAALATQHLQDRELFWIAKEGLRAPLPENWKPCKTTDTDEIYYFNFQSGVWPCRPHPSLPAAARRPLLPAARSPLSPTATRMAFSCTSPDGPGESTWDHPCDEYYRNLYETNKKKMEVMITAEITGTTMIKAPQVMGMVITGNGNYR